MWQLKEMMLALLKYQSMSKKDDKVIKINVNVLDFSDKYTLLTYCYKNKKHRAFEMLMNH